MARSRAHRGYDTSLRRAPLKIEEPRNGAEKVPEVWLCCCHGCCQPRHDRCRLLASQLAKDVRSHAALAPAGIGHSTS